MLDTKERHQVLAFLRYLCKAGAVPLQVRADSWEIHPGVKSAWKKLACAVSIGLFFANTLYKNLSLLHEFVLAWGTPLHQMIIHMILAGTAAMMSFSYYVLYIQYPGAYAAFAGMTLTGIIAGKNTPTVHHEREGNKRWIHRLKEHSLQDLIAIGLPFMTTAAVPVIAASFLSDCTMKLLLYAMLPESWKTWPWFWDCFSVELHYLAMFPAIGTTPWQLQVISFELVNTNLQNIASAAMKSRPQTTGKREEVYKSLRCLQLYVTMANVINGNLIFAWKLLSLGMTIISGYAAIAHFKEHPVFGIMYYFIFFDVTLAYTLMYEKAFRTPALFKQAVNAELTKLGTGRYREMQAPVKNKVLARQLRSIPSMGIKVGQFHTLERTSTPVFLDFVLKNIVSMLMAFD